MYANIFQNKRCWLQIKETDTVTICNKEMWKMPTPQDSQGIKIRKCTKFDTALKEAKART